jgi:D-alanine--poly(phosphoribitol) ligase subunit 2
MEDFLINKIEEIAFSKVEMDESLWGSGILDSIAIVEFASEVEEEYGIEIPFDEIIVENFETLNLLVIYIDKKRQI